MPILSFEHKKHPFLLNYLKELFWLCLKRFVTKISNLYLLFLKKVVFIYFFQGKVSHISVLFISPSTQFFLNQRIMNQKRKNNSKMLNWWEEIMKQLTCWDIRVLLHDVCQPNMRLILKQLIQREHILPQLEQYLMSVPNNLELKKKNNISSKDERGDPLCIWRGKIWFPDSSDFRKFSLSKLNEIT